MKYPTTASSIHKAVLLSLLVSQIYTDDLLQVSQSSAGTSYTNSYSDCQAFAALFANTCNSTTVAPAFSSIPY
jgi:hypothetical protein